LSMRYHLLASGSKGNCLVVVSAQATVIIDCGGPKRYLQDCFRQLGIDYLAADALLLTHQHVDHIKQLDMFRSLTIYAPFEVMACPDERLVTPYETFTVKDLTITPLALSHDSPSTVGYLLDDGSQRLAEVTDTGYVSQVNAQAIADADYYVFESNHDPEMLMRTPRPAYVKRRIAGDCGHLCNQDAAVCLSHVLGPRSREVTLAHISQQANTPQLAVYTLKAQLAQDHVPAQRLLIRAADQFTICSGGR